MNQNWLNDSRLQQFPEKKREFLISWIQKNSGKTGNELVSSFLSFNTLLKKQQLTFTSEEKNVLMQIILDSMSVEEKQRFSAILSLLNKH